MASFCSTCGVEIGFFSRKRVKRSNGAVVDMCKACAAKRSDQIAAGAVVAVSPPTVPDPAPSRPAAAAPQAAAAGRSAIGLPRPALGADPVERLVYFLVESFHRETGMDISADPVAMDRVRAAAAKAADELGEDTEAEINLPFLTANASGPKHMQLRVDRSTLG